MEGVGGAVAPTLGLPPLLDASFVELAPADQPRQPITGSKLLETDDALSWATILLQTVLLRGSVWE